MIQQGPMIALRQVHCENWVDPKVDIGPGRLLELNIPWLYVGHTVFLFSSTTIYLHFYVKSDNQ